MQIYVRSSLDSLAHIAPESELGRSRASDPIGPWQRIILQVLQTFNWSVEMKSSRGKIFDRMIVGCAVCLISPVGATFAGEPPAIKAAIEGREADYRRQDPGVPVWPSTCDCISIDFGFKDARGYRPVRFSVGDATAYYSQDTAETSAQSRARLTAKGPQKILVADEFAEELAKDGAQEKAN